jgi:hypothetical protein
MPWMGVRFIYIVLLIASTVASLATKLRPRLPNLIACTCPHLSLNVRLILSLDRFLPALLYDMESNYSYILYES